MEKEIKIFIRGQIENMGGFDSIPNEYRLSIVRNLILMGKIFYSADLWHKLEGLYPHIATQTTLKKWNLEDPKRVGVCLSFESPATFTEPIPDNPQ